MAIVEAVKGFEYTPVKQWFEVKPNRTTAVTLTLKRWTDMPARGWYSGDVHMHLNHEASGVHMTMEDGRLYAQAEDIHVANLLISNTNTSHIFDQEYFRGGKPDPRSTNSYLLVAQQEFRNNSIYGHMPLLGISKLIEPFFSGHPDTKQWEDYPPNYTIAQAAKKQGGAVGYTHPNPVSGEFPIDLALGVVDALDINFSPEPACQLYYHVLNAA
ncbi:MAG: hypothetical protein ACR2NN_17735 [Bryobacteraceae bacterium]